MKKEFIIHTKMQDVTLWLFEKVNTFPKSQRFILGQQIKNSAQACLRTIIEANNARSNEATLRKLDALNVELKQDLRAQRVRSGSSTRSKAKVFTFLTVTILLSLDIPRALPSISSLRHRSMML